MRGTDAGADEEIGRVEQYAAGLNVEWPELEPAIGAKPDQRGNVGDDRDRHQKQEEPGRLIKTPLRQSGDRVDKRWRQPVQQACRQIERQQHPDEPDRAALPGPGCYGLPPECGKGHVGSLPQRDGVIRERNDGKRGDHERQAEPEQAIAKKGAGRLVLEARPHEQSRQKKEHRHEEAVGGENDHVETDPRLGVGMTEIGVGDDGVMQQDDERQEAPGVINRRVAPFDPRRGMNCVSPD